MMADLEHVGTEIKPSRQQPRLSFLFQIAGQEKDPLPVDDLQNQGALVDIEARTVARRPEDKHLCALFVARLVPGSQYLHAGPRFSGRGGQGDGNRIILQALGGPYLARFE